ncbi:cupin domain-containing protein [Nocardioides aestuarii]|uniref:Cupin domain-containing protein n=1 Tax=Nocardioides aestuarii TaxID=252231 RepID=A0ABW4TT55_9ACTN
MTTGFVLRPDEGRVLDLGSFEARVLADAGDTGATFTLLETRREPPGFGPPLHRHRDAAEAFYVLEGDYLMVIEERQERCPAGSFVYVPQGVAHTFQVVSDGPGRKLNLFSPAAMVGFFEALSRAEAVGTATAELLDAIALEHEMEVLGPVPEAYL